MTIAKASIRLQAWQVRPGTKTPQMLPLDNPRFSIELSLHKMLMGHNVFGGPRKLRPCLMYLLSALYDAYDVYFPWLDAWYVSRIDVAECYDLDSPENVSAWIDTRKLAEYPRRKVSYYASRGLVAVGSTTVLRAYAKGLQHYESGGHVEMKRNQHQLAGAVASCAERYLRCELQANREKLVSLYDKPYGTIVSESDIYALFDEQWQRFVGEANVLGTATVRAKADVWARLQDDNPQSCLSLYMVWSVVALNGESWYRAQVGASTWRRQKSLLEHAGISWIGTDVVTAGAPIADFVPSLSSWRRVSRDPDISVIEALAAYA